jgi:galactose mutarotase-like enzyme
VTLRTPARLPLVLERRMRLTEEPPALRIEETVHSDAPVPTAFLIGHHPAFVASQGTRVDLPDGTPLLVDPGYATDLVDLPPGAEGTWPTLPGRAGEEVRLDTVGSGPVQRLVYATRLGPSPWAAIRWPDEGLGAGLAWDGATFRCAWLWWEIGGAELPWYGRARIVAIEPNTTFPADGLAAARARGAAHELAPGTRHETWITLGLFHADERAVTAVGRDGSIER